MHQIKRIIETKIRKQRRYKQDNNKYYYLHWSCCTKPIHPLLSTSHKCRIICKIIVHYHNICSFLTTVGGSISIKHNMCSIFITIGGNISIKQCLHHLHNRIHYCLFVFVVHTDRHMK